MYIVKSCYSETYYALDLAMRLYSVTETLNRYQLSSIALTF